MLAPSRCGWALGLTLALLTPARPAVAWVETLIQSDTVTVDLERDGSAVVRHEILMRVRGGPFQGFDLDGVDSDAEPLPDATVTPATSGAAGVAPIPVLTEKRDNGALRLEVDQEKGLRRGDYLFRVAYRSRFLERNLVELRGSAAEIHWVGPRFPDGIDSAKVVFRIPAAPRAPEVPETAADRGDLGLEELGGVFLSNLHRSSTKDELEVVRPHVAKGEPVVWRARADAQAFSAFSVPPSPNQSAPQRAEPHGWGSNQRLMFWGAMGAVAALYSLLVLAKWRFQVKACALRSAHPRALIPLGAPLRGALSGSALAGAVALSVLAEEGRIGGLLLLASIALASHLTPSIQPTPRGPGRWLPLADLEAFARRPGALPGCWLDATRLPGFFLFLLTLAAFAAATLMLLPVSPYWALLSALGSSSAIPIFLTGRASELPLDPVSAPRRLLERLAQTLRKRPDVKAVAWGRIPEGSREPDELRLLIVPRLARAGLSAIEVGMEYHHEAGGNLLLPCVLVRVGEGTPAQAALEGQVRWMRGKNPDERVTILRPKLPTFGFLARLVNQLVQSVSELPRSENQTQRNRSPVRPGVGAKQQQGRRASAA